MGDGKADILAANRTGKNVRLFLCELSAPLQFSERQGFGVPLDKNIGFKIAAADFDGDGHQDLAVGTQPHLRLFNGNSCTGDEAGWWREFSLPDPAHETIQPVAADVHHDGSVDLVFSSSHGLYLCLNESDGDLDIALTSFQGNGIHLYVNTSG